MSAATEMRAGGTGSNLGLAMVMYDAGGGTVASLTENWELSEADAAELMRLVKAAWAEGRWADRRTGADDRRSRE